MSLAAPPGVRVPGSSDLGLSRTAARVAQQLLADCARMAKLTRMRRAASQLLYVAVQGVLFLVGLSALVTAIVNYDQHRHDGSLRRLVFAHFCRPQHQPVFHHFVQLPIRVNRNMRCSVAILLTT